MKRFASYQLTLPMPRGSNIDPLALSQVIGLIYEAATDSSAWPLLLEQLGELLMSEAAALSVSAGAEVSAEACATQLLAECLAPHFERANDIHLELSELTLERDGLEAALSRVPLGMAVVRSDGALVSMNRALLSLTRNGGELALDGDRLRTQPSEALPEALRRVFSGEVKDALVTLGSLGSPSGMSVWVSLLRPARSAVQALALVLVASSQSRALSAEALGRLYELTPAEARLAQQLVLGRSLDEACAGQGVSINTGKTHLKRIFSKVGVRRQSELVQAVYASPLWLLAEASEVPSDDAGLARLLANRRSTSQDDGGVHLPDGRRMAYSDQGDPDGHPVVFMHGLAGSRYLRHPDDSLLLSQGVRLIIPERPGSGDSDPLPGRTISDWPNDVAELARVLDLPPFTVMGYSAGTPYALATALALPDRGAALHLVAPVSPVERLRDLRAYPPTSRLNILLARHAPALLKPLLKVAVKDMKRNVFRYVENAMSQSTDSDRRVYESPRLRTAHAVGVLAGVQRGGDELAQEVLLTCGDWGLDFKALQVPVQIWHGEADALVAPEGARQLVDLLPGAKLTMVPGGGHFIIYAHWEEILAGVMTDHRARVPALGAFA
jgi:pimeloyl-ACP methyl ester carboxylesterase/DNA-binding CsgD family transcriptional regulator